MEQPEIIPPPKKSNRPTGWVTAYFRFVSSPNESRILKLMPVVLLGIVPISVLDNFFIPVLGIIDDIPTTVLTVIVLILTWLRVQTYR